MAGDEEFGMDGGCPTSGGITVLWCVMSALVGAVSLAAGFVVWALLEEAREGRWTRAVGVMGRPLG